MHHFDISSPCVCHSVGHNDITGDAANHLATVVLDHAAMTDFCGIPLISLRENCITELNLECKGVGVPGAIVLSKLLPSATAITSLKYACHANVFAFLSAPIDTRLCLVLAVCDSTTSVPKEEPLSRRASRATRRCNRSSKPPASRTSSCECSLSLWCQRPLTQLTHPPPNPTFAVSL